MNEDWIQRARRSDPNDGDSAAGWARIRARREGTAVFLEPLADLFLWDRAPATLQDLAIYEAARLLGADFLSLETRAWPSVSRIVTNLGAKSLEFQRRIACFLHLPSGIEFALLPGQGALLPTQGLIRISPGLTGPRVINISAEPLELHPPNAPGLSLLLPPRIPHPFPASSLTGHSARKPVPSIAPFLIARRPLSRHEAAVILEEEAPPRPELPETGRSLDILETAALHCGLRLPSSREWRFAARAGTYTRFFFGDRFDRRYLWFAGNSEGRAQDPAKHEADGRWNPFGLIDMLGNTWEWTTDSTRQAPFQLGGSFRTRRDAFEAPKRTASRRAVAPDIGFRLCTPLPKVPQV